MENIYSKSITKDELEYYRKGMNKIYQMYLDDIRSHNTSSIIYRIFINSQTSKYLSNNSDERIVIDFIAGMTDDLFISEVKQVQ